MRETYYLDLKDLANNLFYVLTKNKSDINEVSFSQIGGYKNIIKKEAEKQDINLEFVLSRDETIRFFNHNSYMFDRGENNNSIVLREGVTPYHLMYHNSGLPLDVTLLLSSENVEKETLDLMGVKKEKEELKDTKYYIDKLTNMIKYYSSKMEFEKCIELRDKLHDLINIDILINDTTYENNKNKGKVLQKTKQILY